jgi:DNA-binding winged helix-turn-helix (wHTH) protein
MRWCFGRFQLDCESACLWEGEQRLTLRPKTFELLRYLVEHTGELVRKETLLEAVWPDTVVADGVLTTSMGELRKVLGETAKQPQYIATVHRRGYRFMAPVTPLDTPGTSAAQDTLLDTVARPPLFLVTVIEEMVRQGRLRRPATGGARLEPNAMAVMVDIPESLRHMIDQQLEQLHPEERACLEVTSVAGREFAAAAVAAGTDYGVEERDLYG